MRYRVECFRKIKVDDVDIQYFPSSNIEVTSSKKWTNCNTHGLLLRNSNWLGEKRLFSSKCFTIAFFIILSITLHTIEVRLIGL